MPKQKTNYKDGYVPAVIPTWADAYNMDTKEYYTYDEYPDYVPGSYNGVKWSNTSNASNAANTNAGTGTPTGTTSATSGSSSYSPYTSNPTIASLTSEYVNRQPFSFDYEKDPLYQNYLAQYTREGQNAMQNTLAQVSARTGGLASSYAQQAAQGTYNQYMQQAADKIPDIYELRYNEWLNSGDELKNKISLLQDQDDTNYNRYRDTISDDRYADETAYNRERDALEDQRYEDETAYNRSIDERDYNYQVSQDKISNYYKGVSAKNTAYDTALEKAQTLAQYGDFSGYKDLGYTDAQIANMENTYNASLVTDDYITPDKDIVSYASNIYKGGSEGDSTNYKDTIEYLVDVYGPENTDRIKVNALAAGVTAEQFDNYINGESSDSDSDSNKKVGLSYTSPYGQLLEKLSKNSKK